MTISPSQSSAARALLNRMTYEEASNLSGIGKFTIMRFESGETTPKSSTLEKLEKFYKSKGIEFLDHEGVRKAPRGIVRELRGADGFKEFIDDIYNTVKGEGGDICVTNVNERDFERWQGQHAEEYLTNMSTVKNMTFRILLEEGDSYFTASKYAEYRYMQTEHFTGVPFFVYGNKKAEVIFEDNNVTVIITNNRKLADANRKYFEALWEKSIPV